MMTGKERFAMALGGGQPDRVPIWELAFIESSIISIAKHFTEDVPEFKLIHEMDPDEVMALLATLYLVVEELDLDGMTLPVFSGNEVIGENRIRDPLGIVYMPSDNGLAYPLQGPITTRKDLAAYEKPVIDATWVLPAQLAKEHFKDQKAIVLMPPDPWKTYWALQGKIDEALIRFYDDPEMAHGIMRIATDICIDVINIGVDNDVEFFCCTGDLAMNTGPMMSPHQFREFIKPYYKEVVDAAHKRGVPVIKHSCGNITQILEDFLDCGFDGIHPIQPQCMDIVQAKEICKGRAAILGNIDCVDLLPSGTVEEVEETVRETIQKAAPGGGYILASANSIHKDVKAENAIAMFRAARKYGKYPI